jgi:uncharacterized protein YdhG (YjbR/CyaY superfamily)
LKPLTTITAYIAAQPKAAQVALKAVRAAVREAEPNAEEMISYKIPSAKLNGKPLVYYAAWKQHYSLYPASAAVVAALEAHLAKYEVSKGTIRFPYSEPVPVKLIQRLVKLRAKEIVAAQPPKIKQPQKP